MVVRDRSRGVVVAVSVNFGPLCVCPYDKIPSTSVLGLLQGPSVAVSMNLGFLCFVCVFTIRSLLFGFFIVLFVSS